MMCWVGSSHSSRHPAKFLTLCLVKGKTKYFDLSRDHTIEVSLDLMGGFHHPTMFGVHRPCESGDVTFLICHVTTWLLCHINLLTRSPHPKSPPY